MARRGQAWRGLIQVLAGPDPAPGMAGAHRGERRAAYAALGLATLALCVINLATMHAATVSPRRRVLPGQPA